MFCTKCGEKLHEEGLKFCQSCGTKTCLDNPNIISCTTCNKEISKDASNCPNCGAKTKYKKKSEYVRDGSICLGIGIFLGFFAASIKSEFDSNRYTLTPASAEMGLGITTMCSVLLIIIGIILLITSATIEK